MTPRALARILIVDDDPDVREVIELTLGGQGYEVTSVGGGQAALAQLARETFDLIVCDLGMPEVDGIALYGALQRRPAPRPVVLFLSGFQDNARYETFLRETGVPRLVKPFEVTPARAGAPTARPCLRAGGRCTEALSTLMPDLCGDVLSSRLRAPAGGPE